MSMMNDKEVNEYRDVMKPPEVSGFEDGFNWKTVAGAIFLGFVVNPASEYLSLVIGPEASMGGAMKWVLVIFFAEVAKRSFTVLKTQELYTLHYMTGAALADPFSGYLWKQFVATSEYVQGLGLAAELPYWAFPSADDIELAGRTFFTKAWLPIIALTVIGMLISKIEGYLLYRLVNDVERLPFPFAPVSAAGIVALATDRNQNESWRWRSFAVGGMIGMVWGIVYICVPMITGAILPKRVELIPLIFIDFTPQLAKYLPAVPFNLVLNAGAFLVGMVVPFWGVIGGVIGLAITFVANPLLQQWGILANWRPEMSFIDTTFINTIDFYLSFGIGLTFAVTFSQLTLFGSSFIKNWFTPRSTMLNHEKPLAVRFKEGWHILITRNQARGDLSIWICVLIYVFSTTCWIIMGVLLVDGYPWYIMIFYATIYNPLISYSTAKLEGLCGQAVNIPYLSELTILLSGHKGVDIWFAPMPINNYGMETVSFRVLELTGTKIISQVKTLLLTMPIVVVASLLASDLLWRMAPVPSQAYPYTQLLWELQLKQWCLTRTATMEGGSLFLESLHFDYAWWGLASGTALFGILYSVGLPIMLVFGAVWGLGQSSPGAMICQVLGALVGRFYFKPKYKDMWLKYMTVILAGFYCGTGLTTMVAMGFNVIKRMLSPTLW
jgi:hypothetical protein